MFVGVICISTQTNNADANGISLVRDAEIEALIKEYAEPLLKAAGMQKNEIKFRIVNNQQFNAFVSGHNMFLHTGLLLQAKTPNEVIGVIAHEIGHIAGAHQLRLAERVKTAQQVAKITTLLGVGLGAAGTASKDNDTISAGIGVVGGAHSIAVRTIRAYQRDEEATADRAALNYLESTQQSGKGMIETFERLSKQYVLQSSRTDPYLLSHPLPRERITNLATVVKKSKWYNKKDSATLQHKHDMVRAKIAAYVGGETYARSLIKSDELPEPAKLYGNAIIAHLYESPDNAISLIDKLIQQYPNNPYVHEMKGEILLRSGKGKQAADALRNAVKFDKTKAGFIRIQLGHALLETGGQKNIKEAITQIRKGLASDPEAVTGYQYLARAYGEAGQIPNALLTSAELAIRTNKKDEAIEYAKRAQKGFEKGTPGWIRSQDIISLEQKDK